MISSVVHNVVSSLSSSKNLSGLVNGNPFVSGGVLLMAMTAVIAYMRSLPTKISELCKRKLTIQMEVRDQEAFAYLTQWLAEHDYSEVCRLLSVSVNYPRGEPELIFAPGRGTHLFWYNKRLIWLTREKDNDGTGGSTDLTTLLSRENFVLHTWGRDASFLKSLMDDAKRVGESKRKDEVAVYFNSPWGEWTKTACSRPRALESVILPTNVKEFLVADVQEFLDKEDWYVNVGVPYRRGYLLYGPPGNGKSSLVRALASHFDVDLFVLNLASKSLDDERLLRAMHNTKPRAILLLEDVDAIFTERNGESNSGITFSGLLNAIDGVAAQEGRILIMTTNHKERLDEALIRAGRADVHQYIGLADRVQAEQLFLRFFPSEHAAAAEFGKSIPVSGLPMSSLQNHLTIHSKDVYSAVNQRVSQEMVQVVGSVE